MEKIEDEKKEKIHIFIKFNIFADVLNWIKIVIFI